MKKESRNCLICKHCSRRRGNFICEFKKCLMGDEPFYRDFKAKDPCEEFYNGFKVCEFIPRFNMYSNSKLSWNIGVGCKFDCNYCELSFKAQMKRQKPMIDKNGKYLLREYLFLYYFDWVRSESKYYKTYTKIYV